MERFESFDGTRIAFHNRGSGPAVVLVHGAIIGADAQFGPWDRHRARWQEFFVRLGSLVGAEIPCPEAPPDGAHGLMEHLVRAGHRVVAPDLRGHGASDAPRSTVPDAFVRDLRALIDHLDLGAVDVVGYSMGGRITAELVATGDPRIRSAVLGGVGGWIVEGEPFPDGRPVAEWIEELASMLERGELDPANPNSANVLLCRVFGGDPRALAAAQRTLGGRQIPDAALAAVRVPVLVVLGAADPNRPHCERLTAAIGSARFVECAGDHLSALYEPSFQDAVAGFLAASLR